MNQVQRTIWQKARARGAGGQAVQLGDSECAYLIARIAADLGVEEVLSQLPPAIPEFFNSGELSDLSIEGVDPLPLFEQLLAANIDSDMYFACLANLHKARLKYERILETQAIPTLEQVGPRGLLQYGKMSPKALVGLLYWRKWFFDIDNRAGQETGYIFEPVIANAVGGVPVTSTKSPIKRHDGSGKGRQVDCLLGTRAYELKIRMTIAASGQGRWSEELSYPKDCKASGYTPVLIVLDSTPNQKLTELTKAFEAQEGECYVGDAAWAHLDALAGNTMATFLERYVRNPIEHLINEAPADIPPFTARLDGNLMVIQIDGEDMIIRRSDNEVVSDEVDDLPEDVAE